uniref:Tyr recombinase domain-containing protein n=1 Tax=Strigamia maritima TaxID=126957 RepID=T1JKB4_STRMM
MRGFFNNRASFPHFTQTWDVGLPLAELRKMWPYEDLDWLRNSPHSPSSSISSRTSDLPSSGPLRFFVAHTRFQTKRALFLIQNSPFLEPLKDTIRHWIKDFLAKSGVDKNVFGAPTTLSASTSKAAKQVRIQDILNAAGWTSESTIARFYHCSIVNPNAFQNAVLATE